MWLMLFVCVQVTSQYGMPPSGSRQMLMFSATFKADIQQLARKYLHEHVFVTVGRVGGANTDITQQLLCVTRDEKRRKLEEILNAQGSFLLLYFAQ